MSNGYTQAELDGIQAKWNLRFPPDLVTILRERRRVIDNDPSFRSFDWLEADDAAIQDALNWPFEGFLFDVREGLWWPEWGAMPSDLTEREDRFRAFFAEAPKLIPVFGHRYIPEEPHEAGNPVFSVWQMDVIHYGADLADYLCREGQTSDRPPHAALTPKHIRFWSRAVEFNNQRFEGGGGFAFFNKGNVLPDQDK